MSSDGGQVIVGATSEIARAVVYELAKDGGRFIVAARDEEELNLLARDVELRTAAKVTAMPLDVRDIGKHEEFVNSCVTELGGVDGVVLCQGSMNDQAQAADDWALTEEMIEVNYTSAVSLGNLMARHMESRGHGYLCGISSVAGDRGRQSNYLYGSTKAGLTTYLAGLRNRLFRRGVAVITVKPGFVDTSMTWGLLKPGSPLTASPQRIARDIHSAIRRRKTIVYTPWFWRWIMLIIRCIPEWLFRRLSL